MAEASILVGPIPEEHLEHRKACWRYSETQADPEYREVMARLHRVWSDANSRWFEGQLQEPIFELTEPSNPRRLGDCGPPHISGFLSQIRIRPSLLWGTHPRTMPGPERAEGRYLFVADVLLHEMIHQYHMEITGLDELENYAGHGPVFRDTCNRIGADLGLPPTRYYKQTRGPKRGLPICSYWPHCVRPEDYYLGAYIPLAEDDEEPKPIGPLTLAEWAYLRRAVAADPRATDLLARLRDIHTRLDASGEAVQS